MTTSEAVQAFVNAANELRVHDDVEISFEMLKIARTAPIKLQYALYVPAKIYTKEIETRLPEK